MLQVASVVPRHLGVCRHHQLHIARVGQETLAPARSFATGLAALAAIRPPLVNDGPEEVQLLADGPSAALKHNRPLGFTWSRGEKNQADSVHVVLHQVAKHGIAATNSKAAPMARSNEEKKKTKKTSVKPGTGLFEVKTHFFICVIVLRSLKNIVVCSQELVKRL